MCAEEIETGEVCVTETLRWFKEETDFLFGRRAGHNSEPGSPYCHSTVLSPKAPVMQSQSAWDTEPGPSHSGPLVPSGLFLSWGWGPSNSSLPTWLELPPPQPAQTHGPFFSHPCAFKETGTPGVILSYTLPLGRASQDPGPTNPDSITRQIPASQGPTLSVEYTRGCNTPWCPQFPELMSQFLVSVSTAVLRAWFCYNLLSQLRVAKGEGRGFLYHKNICSAGQQNLNYDLETWAEAYRSFRPVS